MERLVLQAQIREGQGSRPARRLRKLGQIPAILYGNLDTPIALQINGHDLAPLVGKKAIIDLKVGDVTETVIIKNAQRGAVHKDILHVDFQAVRMNDRVHITVPVHLTGNPEGTKVGGVLQTMLHNLDIECIAREIPNVINVDVSQLKIGEFITVGDLPIDPKITVLTSSSDVVAVVVNPVLGENEDTDEEGIATQPEVLKQKHSTDAEEATNKEAAKVY